MPAKQNGNDIDSNDDNDNDNDEANDIMIIILIMITRIIRMRVRIYKRRLVRHFYFLFFSYSWCSLQVASLNSVRYLCIAV